MTDSNRENQQASLSSKTKSLLAVLKMYASNTNDRTTSALWNALREAVDVIDHLEHGIRPDETACLCEDPETASRSGAAYCAKCGKSLPWSKGGRPEAKRFACSFCDKKFWTAEVRAHHEETCEGGKPVNATGLPEEPTPAQLPCTLTGGCWLELGHDGHCD